MGTKPYLRVDIMPQVAQHLKFLGDRKIYWKEKRKKISRGNRNNVPTREPNRILKQPVLD